NSAARESSGSALSDPRSMSDSLVPGGGGASPSACSKTVGPLGSAASSLSAFAAGGADEAPERRAVGPDASGGASVADAFGGMVRAPLGGAGGAGGAVRITEDCLVTPDSS